MKWLKSFLVIFLLVMGLVFCACKVPKTKMYNIMSQVEYAYYLSSNEKYDAVLTTGVRESCFSYNGISTQKVDYTVVKVKLKTSVNYADIIGAKIKINDELFECKLDKNPFDLSFMIDLGIRLSDKSIVMIMVENVDDNFQKLSNITKDFKIDYNQAIEIANKYFYKFITKHTKDNNQCECYLKISTNVDAGSDYYWYFTVRTDSFITKSIMIMTSSPKIVVAS